MCGILAYIGKEKLDADHPGITSVARRGPDGSGMRVFAVGDYFLSLGHRRLSIIDLTDNAAQPMSYQDSGLWITFNGEIYNYIELKTELSKSGYEFMTASDTEVLIAAYHKWSEDCLEKLNGMFAFAVWDSRHRVLFVARDRYGVKPIFYWNSPYGLGIASEIKQLTALPSFKASLNLEAAYQFLQYGDFCYDERTLWKDVFELEPGMMFRIELNKWRPCDPVEAREWYSLPPYARNSCVDESEAVEHFRLILEDSVRLRLRSDVPVGFALSGGLDSSSLTCLAAKKIRQNSRLQTFSACYDEPEIDERPFINAVLDDTDVEAHKTLIHPSYIIDNMDFVTRMHDLPTTRMTVLVHYRLCQLIRSLGTKVVLEGQGPDETLAGYSDFFWSYLSELLTAFQLMTAMREYSYFRRNNNGNLLYGARQLFHTMFPNFAGIWSKLNPLAGQESYLNVPALNDQGLKQGSTLLRKQKSLRELHLIRMKLLRAILHNVDRASMAHSVEVRNPFLDYRLVAFCLSLQSSLKIQKSNQKYLLRLAMADVLPKRVRERTNKIGFPSSEALWAKGHLADFYRELLQGLNEIPFINFDLVKNGFENFIGGSVPYDRAFWRLISFQRWLKIFNISI